MKRYFKYLILFFPTWLTLFMLGVAIPGIILISCFIDWSWDEWLWWWKFMFNYKYAFLRFWIVFQGFGILYLSIDRKLGKKLDEKHN